MRFVLPELTWRIGLAVWMIASLAAKCALGDERPLRPPELLEKAARAAESIPVADLEKHQLLANIALARAFAGESAAALRMAATLPSLADQISVIVAVALREIKNGHVSAACRRLDDAAKLAERLKGRERSPAVYFIIDAQIKARNFAVAQRLTDLFDETDGLGRAYVFRDIAEAQLAARSIPDAKKSIHRAQQSLTHSNDPFSQFVWPKLVRLYLQADDLPAALATAQATPDPRGRLDGFLEVATFHGRNGNAKARTEAFRTAHSIAVECEKAKDESALPALGATQVNVGDFDGALQTIRSMNNDSAYHQAILLALIARRQAERGQNEQARTTATQARDLARQKLEGYPLAEVMSVLAKMWVKTNEKAAANNAIVEALNAARAEEYDLDRILAYLDVARAQAAADKRGIGKILNDAVAKGGSSPEFRLATRSLINMQIDHKLYSDARKSIRACLLAKSTQEDAERRADEEVDGRVTAARLMAKARDFDDAYSIANSVPVDRKRWALRNIAATQAQVGKAASVLPKAELEPKPALKAEIFFGAAVGLLQKDGIVLRNHIGSYYLDRDDEAEGIED